MFEDDRGLLQGTLELLVLKALSWNEAHGYGIARWLEAATDDALRVEEGSLYPALHRMRAKGWVEAEWGVSENNRRAKFYRLTEEGRAQLTAKREGWDRIVEVVGKAMNAPRHPGTEDA
ncbi:MAG: PadR family transcriptional regulator [Longimicrobiales bacterium]|nr:PadR family transcriptional regulator [Longimicrobiales bacterium]